MPDRQLPKHMHPDTTEEMQREFAPLVGAPCLAAGPVCSRMGHHLAHIPELDGLVLGVADQVPAAGSLCHHQQKAGS